MTHSTSARTTFESLQDPDMVGASEYRLVHELLDDLTQDEDNEPDLIVGALGEVIEYASQMRATFEATLPSRQNSVTVTFTGHQIAGLVELLEEDAAASDSPFDDKTIELLRDALIKSRHHGSAYIDSSR